MTARPWNLRVRAAWCELFGHRWGTVEEVEQWITVEGGPRLRLVRVPPSSGRQTCERCEKQRFVSLLPPPHPNGRCAERIVRGGKAMVAP